LLDAHESTDLPVWHATVGRRSFVCSQCHNHDGFTNGGEPPMLFIPDRAEATRVVSLVDAA
jgi:mono/diheme cytochrome c family protein